jgi:hypothetical protein
MPANDERVFEQPATGATQEKFLNFTN